MRKLFDDTAYECSRIITHAYSTSFSLGIRTLSKDYHPFIYAIYGFVRYADEIVDTFHDQNKSALLRRFKKDTYDAIEDGISLNPVLHSFQDAVNQFKIDPDLIEAFLLSMEMDLSKKDYTNPEYEKYIYGSAEVVGLMCLKVFCHGDESQYQELLPAAKHLGAAFQKVNFLRDIRSDFDERGRTYFPSVDFEKFTVEDKEEIEKDIKNDFKLALEGIKGLPKGARAGVYLAYVYYSVLFKKITRLSPETIKSQRIRIPNFRKLVLWLTCYFRDKTNYIIE